MRGVYEVPQKMDYLRSAIGLSVSIHVNIQKCLGPLKLQVVISYIM